MTSMPTATQYVYFVQAASGGLIKIGYAANVAARVDRLQTGCPVPLRVLAVLPSATAAQDETTLHQQFADSRAHGEWFRPTPLLMRLIGKLEQEVDPLLKGDETALEQVWKLGRGQRVKARRASRVDLLDWVGEPRRSASARQRDKRTAAELLVYMPDDLITVEEAIESRKKAHGEAATEPGA